MNQQDVTVADVLMKMLGDQVKRSDKQMQMHPRQRDESVLFTVAVAVLCVDQIHCWQT